MKILVICPSRSSSLYDQMALEVYVKELESAGHKVYCLTGDNGQNDLFQTMLEADQIHIWKRGAVKVMKHVTDD